MRFVLAFSGLLLTVGLVACGGDGDDEGDPTGTSAAGGVTISGAEPPAGPTDQPATVAGDTGAASSDDIDACSLLLLEDIEPLLGSSPEPTDGTVGPFATCSYWDTSAAFVQFQVCRCLPGEEFDASLDAGASALGVEVKEVGGAGERAFWMEGILWVQQGDVVFNLWISRPSYFESDGTALGGADLEAVALPDAQSLAQTIVSRLN